MIKQSAVVCEGLSKRYDGGIPAVNALDLAVKTGEVLALLGPSGCGKTTTLRLIAGFIHPDQGQIQINGRTVAGNRRFVPPEKRGISMVFQEHALFPHLNARENVGFALSKEQVSQAEFMLRLVGLEKLANRYPHELSGGERQRVALARALAPKPFVVLFDEPFSNLDADRRLRMREEVRAILKTTGSTAIFVTHDQEEAMYMGDRLAVMKDGSLHQIGSPEEVFHNPQTRFVASFLGMTDFLPGRVVSSGVETEIGVIRQPVDLPTGTEVEMAFRMDDLKFETRPGAQAMVLSRQFKGPYNIYRLRLASGRLIHVMTAHTQLIKPGTPVQVEAAPGHALACFSKSENVSQTED